MALALEQQIRHKFWRRLLIWSGLVAIGIVAARAFVPAGPWIASLPVLAATALLGVGVGIAALVYCFTTFLLTRELRFLMMSAAYGALAGGAALQGLADILFPAPSLFDGILTASWLLASVLFAGSSFSHSALKTPSKLLGWMQSVVGGALVVAAPLAMLPYALNFETVYGMVASSEHAMLAFVLDTSALVAATVFISLALIGNYNRFVHNNDRLSLIICFFLVPCVFSLLYRVASSDRFDEWWFYSYLLMCGSWIALATGFSVESAFAHKDADDRLSELEVLHDVSWSLIGTNGLGELLSVFTQMVREKTCAGIAAVYVADPDGQTLELAAVSGREQCPVMLGARYATTSTARWPGFHTGHTARAFVTGEMQVADDVFVDVEFVPWRVIAVDNGRAVSLPLMDQGAAVGVLNLYYHQQEQCTPERLKLLGTIAASAGPAISGARGAHCESKPEIVQLAA